MDFDSFLGYVQDRAQLDSTGAALQITRITLTTLSERIQAGEADDLAAQLPREIDRFLTEIDTVDAFEFEEFVDRVTERGDYQADERADAVFHAQVVLDVVSDAVDETELRQVRDQLPDGEGWAELFEIADQEESVSPSDHG
ncbi:DUF2267 domain-containing protein [Halorientalis salina]|uniref:DUF2267 domain-containing protein n=1 Tax=Halorientalis salina TaxID=2932266 RepID=UPI0010AC159B|nr:DUF2267 domain-containing protein [Halorientalis salina]